MIPALSPSSAPGPRPGRAWPPVLALLGFAALVYLRLLYQVSWFPPFVDGEEANGLVMAQGLTESVRAGHSWWQVLALGASEYNKGYGWALIPFYSIFGYDLRLYFYGVTAALALLCGAFYLVFRRAHPQGSLAGFVVVTAFPLLALAVRRYKWHSLDYLAALAVYVYFLPEVLGRPPQAGDWRWRLAGAGLFGVACFFYFGAALYIVPWAVLVIWFEGRRHGRRLLRYGAGAVALAAATGAALHAWNGLWRSRVQTVIAEAIQTYRAPGLHLRQASVVEYFKWFSTPPYTVLLFAGLGSGLYRMWRGHAFAQVTLVLFALLWGFQLAIGGINNADQMNWSMIPLLGILLLGAEALLGPLGRAGRAGRWVAWVLAAGVFAHELRTFPEVNSRFFLQPYLAKNNTRAQAALLVRDLAEHGEPGTRYLLPAAAWPEDDGGFSYGQPRAQGVRPRRRRADVFPRRGRPRGPGRRRPPGALRRLPQRQPRPPPAPRPRRPHPPRPAPPPPPPLPRHLPLRLPRPRIPIPRGRDAQRGARAGLFGLRAQRPGTRDSRTTAGFLRVGRAADEIFPLGGIAPPASPSGASRRRAPRAAQGLPRSRSTDCHLAARNARRRSSPVLRRPNFGVSLPPGAGQGTGPGLAPLGRGGSSRRPAGRGERAGPGSIMRRIAASSARIFMRRGVYPMP